MFCNRFAWPLLLVLFVGLDLRVAAQSNATQPQPNVLIITVDDMSADSLGAFGCALADTSPNIDQFASQALVFDHAHVHVGNCMPGRNIMWSGMFSHVNGVEGFRQQKQIDYPVLCDLAKQAGYFTGIRGKVSHSTPYTPYAWDAVLDSDAKGKKYHIKDAESYGASMRNGIRLAKRAQKPFCLMINISDPHKPFHAQGKNGVTIDDPHVPTKIFSADEVPVPGFLPDDAVIRKELAHYYSSVRRADDCFREIMRALGTEANNTFVLFLSDHGMPLPFAKTQLYHHSTRTPLMVRWPGVTKPGRDRQHMLGTIDLLPTLLEVMQTTHPTPNRLHGRSFASLLRGEKQADRSHVILQYNENAGKNRHPMRGIQTRDFLYLYNPWSDGVRKFATATTGTMTYRQMVKRAPKESYVQERLQLFDHRVVEELYNVTEDPDCLVNLIGDTKHQSVLDDLRHRLTKELTRIKDRASPLVADWNNADLRQQYMEKEDLLSKQLKQQKKKKKTSPKLNKDAIELRVPKTIKGKDSLTVTIKYKLPAALKQQSLHVTLKASAKSQSGANGKRIHREVIKVAGHGETEVQFEVPSDHSGYRIAAFVGNDFESNLVHVISDFIQCEPED